jgi:hypothetical protein
MDRLYNVINVDLHEATRRACSARGIKYVYIPYSALLVKKSAGTDSLPQVMLKCPLSPY